MPTKKQTSKGNSTKAGSSVPTLRKGRGTKQPPQPRTNLSREQRKAIADALEALNDVINRYDDALEEMDEANTRLRTVIEAATGPLDDTHDIILELPFDVAPELIVPVTDDLVEMVEEHLANG